ncbi:MAG: S8 family serine peptidase [Chloroflexi bacterium]|nr:S8 family serine peptidase [Chloroflexota bacterium]
MSSQPTQRTTDWLSLIVCVLVLCWISGSTLGIQFIAFLLAAEPGAFLQRTDITAPQIFFGAAVVQGLALLIPLLPFAVWWRAVRYRAAFRAWLGAAVFALLLAPTRLIPSTAPQFTMLLQMLLALLFAVTVWLRTGRGHILECAASNALAVALFCGILLALPWLAWGALGSPFDVLSGIAAALAIACAATLLSTRVWLRDMAHDSRGAGWDIAFGGFVVGAMLLVMGSAIGFNGTQVWFMLGLAALGWLLMPLVQVNFQATRGSNARALFALVALVTAAPMLFLDPKAGILVAVIGSGELLVYAFGATALIVLGAWLLGLILSILHKRLATWQTAQFAWVSVGAVALIGSFIYFIAGQPGFFGDQVFVILKAQPDVSAAKNMADYTARRKFVYATLTAHAAQSQSDLRATLDGLHVAYTPYYLMNALQVDADGVGGWLLSRRDDVDRVLPAPVMRPLPAKPPMSQGAETTAPTAPEWNLTMIGADRVWNELNVRGKGILVGQSDSGVEGTHPELSAQYRGRDGNNDYNWLDPWFHSTSPVDIGGHGTHTLGSILGKHIGVAPDAEWIGCVNLARNLGNPGLYLNCMQFLLAPFPQNGDALRDGNPGIGALVANNSWGCPDIEGCDPNALLPAVRALRDAGVFVVASAGNDGPGCSSIKDPLALYDDVFSVGAIDRAKRMADFSSRGPVTADGSGRIKPDIAAPGVRVYSALPGGAYGANSGTSMAGPHVVGVVALMWSANPQLIGDIDRTEQILRETAQPANIATEKIVCGDPNAKPNDFVGYGIVDAYAAVKRALAEK